MHGKGGDSFAADLFSQALSGQIIVDYSFFSEDWLRWLLEDLSHLIGVLG